VSERRAHSVATSGNLEWARVLPERPTPGISCQIDCVAGLFGGCNTSRVQADSPVRSFSGGVRNRGCVHLLPIWRGRIGNAVSLRWRRNAVLVCGCGLWRSRRPDHRARCHVESYSPGRRHGMRPWRSAGCGLGSASMLTLTPICWWPSLVPVSDVRSAGCYTLNLLAFPPLSLSAPPLQDCWRN
jgi:hypothetical protein